MTIYTWHMIIKKWRTTHGWQGAFLRYWGQFLWCQRMFSCAIYCFVSAREHFLAAREPFLAAREHFLTAGLHFLAAREHFLAAREHFLALISVSRISFRLLKIVRTQQIVTCVSYCTTLQCRLHCTHSTVHCSVQSVSHQLVVMWRKRQWTQGA